MWLGHLLCTLRWRTLLLFCPFFCSTTHEMSVTRVYVIVIFACFLSHCVVCCVSTRHLRPALLFIFLSLFLLQSLVF